MAFTSTDRRTTQNSSKPLLTPNEKTGQRRSALKNTQKSQIPTTTSNSDHSSPVQFKTFSQWDNNDIPSIKTPSSPVNHYINPSDIQQFPPISGARTVTSATQNGNIQKSSPSTSGVHTVTSTVSSRMSYLAAVQACSPSLAMSDSNASSAHFWNDHYVTFKVIISTAVFTSLSNL